MLLMDTKLPAELCYKILSHMDPPSRVALLRTSRAVHAALRTEVALQNLRDALRFTPLCLASSNSALFLLTHVDIVRSAENAEITLHARQPHFAFSPVDASIRGPLSVENDDVRVAPDYWRVPGTLTTDAESKQQDTPNTEHEDPGPQPWFARDDTLALDWDTDCGHGAQLIRVRGTHLRSRFPCSACDGKRNVSARSASAALRLAYPDVFVDSPGYMLPCPVCIGHNAALQSKQETAQIFPTAAAAAATTAALELKLRPVRAHDALLLLHSHPRTPISCPRSHAARPDQSNKLHLSLETRTQTRNEVRFSHTYFPAPRSNTRVTSTSRTARTHT
ncbi:hypothetical protein A0H81_04769 [Grifola frondosa]|uniref:F-box domain-containing protein n=1 Tax=Grifola frondosa TaxID=5627 RepID=A0A1C7MEP1_GRIFR|nr:hypothetical protein A0H81_04769 [Grifola frondosa]